MCRSSEWGTMPLHWYFTSALPRALLAGLPLAALGVALERRVRGVLACVLLYIAAYSLLPHKEVSHAQSIPPSMHSSAALFTDQSSESRVMAQDSCQFAASMLPMRCDAGMQGCWHAGRTRGVRNALSLFRAAGTCR